MELRGNVVGTGIQLDRRGWRLLAGMAAMLLAITLVAPASADHGIVPGPPTTTLGVQPDGIHGNPTCSDVTDDEAFLREEKIDEGDFDEFEGDDEFVTLNVYQTAQGQAFDFEFNGDLVAASVVVKGGPDANLYDYVGSGHEPGAQADTFLHAPVNQQNNKFYGLSHISFCVAEAPANLDITKTAVDDTISGGDHAAFDIQVGSLGPATAESVTLTDELPNGDLTWEVTSHGTDVCHFTDGTDNTEGNNFVCDLGDLAEGESVTVSVQTTEALDLHGSAKCGDTLNNTAFVVADNVEQLKDSATIDVKCGSIVIEKTYSVAPAESPDEDDFSTFTVFLDDGDGQRGGEIADMDATIVDDTTVHYCLDELGFDDYVVGETDTPEGFGDAPDTLVTVDEESTCDSRNVGQSDVDADAGIENEASPVDLVVTKKKLSFDSVDGFTTTDVLLADFEYTLYAGDTQDSDNQVGDPQRTSGETGNFGTTTFTDLEVDQTFTVCETDVPTDEDGYWSAPGDHGITGNSECRTFTTALNQDEAETFYNAPKADVSVGFTDVTGFTSVTITCRDEENDVVVEETFTSSDAVDLTQLDLGDYTCDIEVRNGSTS